MGKNPANKMARPAQTFSLGDRVEVVHFGPGKIVEIRGPLGPDGAEVYRVMYRRKPRVAYLEVLGNQLRLAGRIKRFKRHGGKLPPVTGTPS